MLEELDMKFCGGLWNICLTQGKDFILLSNYHLKIQNSEQMTQSGFFAALLYVFKWVTGDIGQINTAHKYRN